MLRNKLFLAISGGAVLLIVVVLLVLFLVGGGSSNTNGAAVDPFADTSGERPFDIDTDRTDTTSGTSSAPILQGDSLPVLRKLTEAPVSSVTTLRIADSVAVEPYARYVERGTGHVFDVNLSRTTEPHAVTIETVPRIQQSAWAQNGSTTLVQYLGQDASTLSTFLGTLKESAPPDEGAEGGAAYEMSATFLAENIIGYAFAPTKNEVFYLVPTDAGSVGYIESLDTKSRRQVWASPLRELAATWNSPDHILVTTKPSSDSVGWAWRVNLKNGQADLLLSEVVGLTTLENRAGTKVLFSTLETTLAALKVLNLSTGAVSSLSLITLPEKCTWSARETAVLYCAIPFAIPQKREFPEGWYQGTVTWRDNIWRINTDTGTTKMLASVNDLVDRTVDAVDLTLSPDEDFLVFRAREDDSLWSLKLPEQGEAPGTEAGAATTF